MEAAQRVATLARLRRIEGQVRGLQRMLDEAKDCEQIMTQLMAARSALEQVSLHVLSSHIQDCVLKDVEVPGQAMQDLQDYLSVWARFGTPATYLPD